VAHSNAGLREHSSADAHLAREYHYSLLVDYASMLARLEWNGNVRRNEAVQLLEQAAALTAGEHPHARMLASHTRRDARPDRTVTQLLDATWRPAATVPDAWLIERILCHT
jgi:hypothetical protein